MRGSSHEAGLELVARRTMTAHKLRLISGRNSFLSGYTGNGDMSISLSKIIGERFLRSLGRNLRFSKGGKRGFCGNGILKIQ